MIKKLFHLFLFLFFVGVLSAQNIETLTTAPTPCIDAQQKALSYLFQNKVNLKMTDADVQGLNLQDSYITQHNGLTHLFFEQTASNIPLYNGIVNVTVMPSGEILFVGNRSLNNLVAKINSTQAVLTPEQAIQKACEQLKIALNEKLAISKGGLANTFIADKGNFVLSDVHIALKFQKIDENHVRLAWELNLDKLDASDHWSLRIDALDGKILEKNSLTVHCKVAIENYAHVIPKCNDELAVVNGTNSQSATRNQQLSTTLAGGGSYNIFQLPFEAPSFGARALVTDPADAKASPYGWHDTNGVAGAEYTITQGNNVHAYLDVKELNKSVGDEPDGGAGLIFDFPYSATAEPAAQQKAAVVNLFYINNMMHDIAFGYGFDEVSGNFQKKNYTNLSAGNDDVQAEAQDGSGLGASSFSNNANFATPPDGQSPRMQMYLWTNNASKLLHITAPSFVVDDYTTGVANFGTVVTATTKFSGDVLIASGSTGTDGCVIPDNDLTGKIALVDRGTCYFADKAYNVQQKGAIAVVICNTDEGVIGMASAGVHANDIKIPVVMISKSDCQKIRIASGAGLKGTIFLDNSLNTGPQMLDGDFDNGIVTHEYTHGISARLTGGRLNTGCSSSGELKAGEGWSDFLALMVTATPNDAAIRTRGLGTYALYEKPVNTGIRRHPYSIDMNKNPLTYDDIILNNEVHDVGEVWCSALWEIYWKMIDLYGYKVDVRDKTSGNGKTFQLVIDAMKIQPCAPGFLDARDAILAADKADFNGANACLIWSAFAKRGMGNNADQGSAALTYDNTQGFDNLPACVKTLKIQKTAIDNIKPGDIITYTVKVLNNKGTTATGVVVTDEIATGATYVSGSASRNVIVSGSSLQWQIGTMQNLDSLTLTYQVKTDPTKKSTSYFFDDFEKGDKNWDYEVLSGAGLWEVLDLYSYSGKYAMSGTYPTVGASDFATKTLNSIHVTGTKPILRFYSRYQTEPAADGGVVQISANNGSTWDNVDSKFFKNGYRGVIHYGTLTSPSANQQAFWGDNKTFQASCVDLSSYAGKDIKLRFRFACDSLIGGLGWFVDDVTVMDMFNYNPKSSLTTAQGDTATAYVAQGGTIVNPTVFLPTSAALDDVKLNVYPNPTNNWINLNIIGGAANSLNASIISIDGRTVWQKVSKMAAQTETLIPVDMSAFSNGVYFVRIETDTKTIVEKIVKQ